MPAIQTEWDTREFASALQQYMSLSKKTESEAVNKVAKDVALLAAQANPPASTATIKALKDQPWWVRYISKKLAAGGFSYVQQYQDKSQAYVTKSGKTRFKTKRKKIDVRSNFSRASARAASKAIIAKRTWSTSFLKVAWLKVAAVFGGMSGASSVGQRMTQAKGNATKARPEQLESLLTAQYEGIKNESVIAGKESAILRDAMRRKTADMMIYVERKLTEIWGKRL